METATETAVSLGRSRRRRPGEPSPREINREQRFEQILHAAYVCFTKKGFHSTSMSDIAREAGVSVGHLYNFFESRDAIVEAFAQRELDRLRKMDEFYRESNFTQEERCRRSVYGLALTKLDKTAARLTFEILSESVVNYGERPVVAQRSRSSDGGRFVARGRTVFPSAWQRRPRQGEPRPQGRRSHLAVAYRRIGSVANRTAKKGKPSFLWRSGGFFLRDFRDLSDFS